MCMHIYVFIIYVRVNKTKAQKKNHADKEG